MNAQNARENPDDGARHPGKEIPGIMKVEGQLALQFAPGRSGVWGLGFMICAGLVALIAFAALNYRSWKYASIVAESQQAYRRNPDLIFDSAFFSRWTGAERALKAAESHSVRRNAVMTYGVLPFAAALFFLGRRLRARPALELLEADPRMPVLYYRSFTDEGSERNRDERRLVAWLRRVGPVVAIGRPGESVPQLGAARFYSADDRWQQVAIELMRYAQLVVLRAGTTAGLVWELRQVRAHVSPERVVLWVPNAADTDAYRRFREVAEPCLGTELPAVLEASSFVTFDAVWRATAVDQKSLRRRLASEAAHVGSSTNLTPAEVEKLHAIHALLAGASGGVVVERPPLRLPWWALALPLLLWFILTRLRSRVLLLGDDVTVMARIGEAAAGLLAALAAAFAVWIWRPTRTRLPAKAFAAIVVAHLTLVAARCSGDRDTADGGPCIENAAMIAALDQYAAAVRAFQAAGGWNLTDLRSPGDVATRIRLLETLDAALSAMQRVVSEQPSAVNRARLAELQVARRELSA